MVALDASSIPAVHSLAESLPGGSSLCLPMTYEDYAALGESHHDEYYDGLVFVNPPSEHHVRVARRLTRVLEDACPAGFETAPEWGWQAVQGSVLRPDIMVYAPRSRHARQLEFPPLLVVEVSSHSTKAEDWGRKREIYAVGGAAWYWIVDPAAEEVTVMANEESQFEITRQLRGGSVHQLTKPFPITVDLVALFA